jgi:hypothetical protein
MAFNPQCSVQNCIDKCCNNHGTCPSDYSSGGPDWTTCKYYYKNIQSSGDYEDSMALSYGLSFAFVGIFFFIALVVWIYKKRQAAQNQA